MERSPSARPAPSPNGRDPGEAGALPPGKLAQNILFFARALRHAGLPVRPGAVLDALQAVAATPFGTRDDFREVLHAVFVKRHEHTVVFDGVFRVFWKRRGLLEQMIAAMSPVATPERKAEAKPRAGANRVADALFPRARDPAAAPSVEWDATLTASETERLRRKDFAQMTAAEIARATAAIARLRLPEDELVTRRLAPDPRGRRLDPRRSFRRSLRAGGATIELARRANVVRPPSVVAICDVSGSVGDYSRVVLHFLHALASRRKVTSFLFGTRLTNVTRALARKDVDEALASTEAAVADWSGGTRIGESLRTFNKLWSRRVLGGSATVLLFTDGLEREAGGSLADEMARLQRSCRRLVWLNPLLRFDGFEARASGIRAMLPFVDEFRPIHNLNAVADLCRALGEARPRTGDPRAWLASAP